MNWDRIEGNWKEFKGEAKAQWAKLTDDDLNVIDGHREQLEAGCRNITVMPRTRRRRKS
jgi:uncharacterized protein YjbJ (UPF0337 family)